MRGLHTKFNGFEKSVLVLVSTRPRPAPRDQDQRVQDQDQRVRDQDQDQRVRDQDQDHLKPVEWSRDQDRSLEDNISGYTSTTPNTQS